MDWRLKALAFRVLELPGGAHAHYFLQRHVTRTWPRPERTLMALAGIADRIIADHRRHRGGIPRTLLEVGAGRDLAVPLALRRAGVRRVVTVDVDRLARLDLINAAAARVAPEVRFDSWEDMEAFGISYRAPQLVDQTLGRFECTCSNEVLEHVPPDQLVDLLAGLRAVTTGITTHSIDYSDHYARSDPKVSRLNFLRYSDAEWRPFNSGKQYVNRLRHSDYLRLFREAGFQVVEESCVAGDPPQNLQVADQFRRYAPADLFALKGQIIAA